MHFRNFLSLRRSRITSIGVICSGSSTVLRFVLRPICSTFEPKSSWWIEKIFASWRNRRIVVSLIISASIAFISSCISRPNDTFDGCSVNPKAKAPSDIVQGHQPAESSALFNSLESGSWVAFALVFQLMPYVTPKVRFQQVEHQDKRGASFSLFFDTHPHFEFYPHDMRTFFVRLHNYSKSVDSSWLMVLCINWRSLMAASEM